MKNEHPDSLKKLFELTFKNDGPFEPDVGLDEFAQHWHQKYQGQSTDPRQSLTDPIVSQTMIDDLHSQHNCTWSYGGYLENRSFLLADSYLKQSGNFIHLGVDFNLPAGTPIIASFSGSVRLIDDDKDTSGGWGQRLIVLPDSPNNDYFLIFAHLEQIQVVPDQQFNPGDKLAHIGRPPYNGNWWPHLHLQTVLASHLKDLLRTERLAELDGYTHPDLITSASQLYIDPVTYLAKISKIDN